MEVAVTHRQAVAAAAAATATAEAATVAAAGVGKGGRLCSHSRGSTRPSCYLAPPRRRQSGTSRPSIGFGYSRTHLNSRQSSSASGSSCESIQAGKLRKCNTNCLANNNCNDGRPACCYESCQSAGSTRRRKLLPLVRNAFPLEWMIPDPRRDRPGRCTCTCRGDCNRRSRCRIRNIANAALRGRRHRTPRRSRTGRCCHRSSGR